MNREEAYSFEDFQEIVARLRAEDGCPWDRVQTHMSLRDCMIEEAYEAAEGIDIYQNTGNDDNLCEELGDVLLQVVMHARIAEEEGRFSMADVLRGVSEKMVRRHPHVFGAGDANDISPSGWETIKQQEKQEKSAAEGMRRVARALPANIRAAKVQKKAVRAGWNFMDERHAAAKAEEAYRALQKRIGVGKKDEIFEEFGNLMFSIINFSRFLDVNAENALTNATEKFINRFEYIEEKAELEGLNSEDMGAAFMNEL